MNTRLFTFGCSFTNYYWPTWADIMALNYDHYQNWGATGGGNHYIFYSLIEAIAREKINSTDTVTIMWTSVGREDRFLNDHWSLQGSIYYSSFPDEYVKNFTDPTGFFLTSVTVIDAVRKILDSIGCRYYFFSTVPFEKVDDSFLELIFSLKKDVEFETRNLYKNTLNKINPSVYEIIFNNNWHSKDDIVIPSASKKSLDNFEIQYNKCAGKDWPVFAKFIDGQLIDIDPAIVKELEDQFQFISFRDNILNKRQDTHPIPSEHAEYLQKLGFTLTAQQLEFVQEWTDKVLSESTFRFNKSKIKRF
jgi:hypothetical protein